MWYLYILKCSDGSFYTGVSGNVYERFKRHSQGKGSNYTKLRRPLKLIYYEVYEEKISAVDREKSVKKLSVKNKEHLIKYGQGVSLVTVD